MLITSGKRKSEMIPASPSSPPPSTKRVKMMQRPRAPAPPATPRLIRTAPVTSRLQNLRKKIYDPQAVVVSFKTDGSVPTLSSFYNPDDDQIYLRQCFVVKHVMGTGSFGKVVCAKSKDDGKCYAIKYTLEPFHTLSNRRQKLEEVKKHELLPSHPNLVKFYCAWEEKGRLYIQTELCAKSLGDMCKELHELPEATIWRCFIDVLLAINHLHANDLLHVDIKPENIFVKNNGVCKLGDFGLVFDERTDSRDTATEGDCKYLAAEVLNDRPTKAADIFSLGITLFELATDLDLPQNGTWWKELRTSIPTEFMKGVSEDLRVVIYAMMRADPASRPTAANLLDDPIVQRHMTGKQREIYMSFKDESREYEPVDMDLIDVHHDIPEDLNTSSMNETVFFGGDKYRSIQSLPGLELDDSRSRIFREPLSFEDTPSPISTRVSRSKILKKERF